MFEAWPGGWEPLGEGKPELSFSLQASRCRNRRSELSPLLSASDTAWMESLGWVAMHGLFSSCGEQGLPSS